ncbi:MAG: ligase protein [Candidatus Moranbacteria bacterium GW2011_GWE2_35_164]|nr:MAG: ligase protein [Candidatus Moranbacteria bacterium GW2011_GWE2_35_164]
MQKIIHFVSRKGFDIEGLGEKIVEQLIQEGVIENFADIFEITKGDLKPLERFKRKKYLWRNLFLLWESDMWEKRQLF